MFTPMSSAPLQVEFSRKQALKWSLRCRTFVMEVPSADHQLQKGGKISRTGQREKLDCDALAVSMRPLDLE